jgi:hypothetical protein
MFRYEQSVATKRFLADAAEGIEQPSRREKFLIPDQCGRYLPGAKKPRRLEAAMPGNQGEGFVH